MCRRHGLQEGQLVKVSCLSSDADLLLGDKSIAERDTQEQQVAADLAAAAAAAEAPADVSATATPVPDMVRSCLTRWTSFYCMCDAGLHQVCALSLPVLASVKLQHQCYRYFHICCSALAK
jgi:hypothetical protein